MPDGAARPGLLLYCQHVPGMGHLVRSLALARALTDRFRVVFLNGGAMPRGIGRPGGVEFVDLTPIALDADGDLASLDRRRSLERVLTARCRTILETFQRVGPAVVLAELFPFGRKKFAPELIPLFDVAHDLGRSRPLLVTSVRDILAIVRDNQVRHDDRAGALANRYLDAVLVHADPRFVRFEESFRPRQPLQVPVHYTGFVTAPVRATAGAAAPPGGARRVVVSAGGGLVGGPLLRAAVEAHALLWASDRIEMTVIGGPSLPPDDWAALRAAAAHRPGLMLRRTVPDLRAELVGAAVSVSQCGYNTALEVVQARVPAVVVPFSEDASRDEQWERARRLERLGAVRVLAPERLDAVALAAMVRDLLVAAVPAVSLDLDGAPRTAALLDTMVRAREQSDPWARGMPA
jgi:predicted glycosyltransferase